MIKRLVPLSIFVLVLLAACGGGSSFPDAAKQALAPVNSDLEKVLTDARGTLSSLAQLPAVRGTDLLACSAAMAEQIKPYNQYTIFGATGLDGELSCQSVAGTNAVNILDRAYYQRTLQSKDMGVGDYQIGRATGKKSVGLGFPILDGSNNPQGVVIAPLDLDWMNQHLAQQKLPDGAELVLLDSKGTILATVPNAPAQVGQSIADKPLGTAMLAQVDGTGEFAGTDGATRVYAFTAPKGSNKNWIVAVGTKK